MELPSVKNLSKKVIEGVTQEKRNSFMEKVDSILKISNIEFPLNGMDFAKRKAGLSDVIEEEE